MDFGNIMEKLSERSVESYESHLKHLKNLQKKYEADEKYNEAEEILQEITKYKEKYRKKEIEKLRSKQRTERQTIESVYKAEQKKFNSKWEILLENHCEKFKIQEKELLDKQEVIYNKEKESLEKSVDSYFKPSAQLLNAIKCKEKAVLAKKYKEAQSLTNEIEKVFEYEKNKFFNDRTEKINKKLSIFKKKLDKEIEVLRLNQQTEFRELKKFRISEKEGMGKKLENLCRELENAQNIEVNIAKGLHTTNAGRRSPQRPSTSLKSERTTPSKFLTHKKSLDI